MITDALDREIRTAAFIHVRRMLELRDPLTSEDLARGFLFRGERIPLVNPQRGIFKPREMKYLLGQFARPAISNTCQNGFSASTAPACSTQSAARLSEPKMRRCVHPGSRRPSCRGSCAWLPPRPAGREGSVAAPRRAPSIARVHGWDAVPPCAEIRGP